MVLSESLDDAVAPCESVGSADVDAAAVPLEADVGVAVWDLDAAEPEALAV